MSFVENLQSGMMRQCSYATDVAENCPPPRTAGTLQSPLVQQPRLGSDWSALFFVWGIWVVALVATLWFTAHFSSNLPLWDDWWQVLQLTGDEPVTLKWLWSQTGEHRIPVPRVICWSLFKLTGSNFRATVYLSVALLGLAALVLLRAANRLRGRTSYSDAFIPLILLTWSQYPNLIWSHQIQMISSTVLACVLLALVVRQDAPFGPRLMLGAGLSVLLLPLCGANGLAMTPGLALWLAYQGFRRWRLRERVDLGRVRAPDLRCGYPGPGGLLFCQL